MRLRASLAGVALFALTGSIGSVSAADGAAEVGVAPVETPADQPRFMPSVEAQFDASFNEYNEPAAVALPSDAVDLANIEPLAETSRTLGSGIASWYGREFAGRKTASGERFDPAGYTAAHRTLPFGTKVRVTRGDRSVVVRINDRGPFHGGRVIDLSQAAAAELGLVRAGSGQVELALLES